MSLGVVGLMNDPSCISSYVEYWLHRATIMMLYAPCPSYHFEHYLNWMNTTDAELGKAIRDRENTIKSLITKKMEVNKKKRS